MGIVIFTDNAKTEYQNSRNLTESLTKLHLEQSTAYNINKEIIWSKKNYNVIQKGYKFDNRFTKQQNSFKQD